MTRQIDFDKDLTIRVPTLADARGVLEELLGEGDGWIKVKGQTLIEITGAKANETKKVKR